ncbi:hypothetical protein [Acinetobacter nosocomialis]|uniref:hypothetical protein n=1 Tax=Acinetobacter nosocomialis TaxID=106654 RepID=UPI001B81132A|nr:hypothetical protein [Acinetobacter nosocomialis]MBR7685888.1 hypothetical protein [Acinetobacter nosocomialis]MBR7700261.1 hypothetical protein [Acinetobacter nosocomialis]MBR7759109.1 hypothetical protein [Acinetobacter nosocomialis]MCE5995676.1 hypothetical protein [Acinetobacter nosocomialis]
MIFLTPEVYKQIEDLKKKIQAQILKIAKDSLILNSKDFQIQFSLVGHVNSCTLSVFCGGTNEDCSNSMVILDGYTKPFKYDSLAPSFWQQILDDLIAGHKKLRELKKQQVAEAKKLEAL